LDLAGPRPVSPVGPDPGPRPGAAFASARPARPGHSGRPAYNAVVTSETALAGASRWFIPPVRPGLNVLFRHPAPSHFPARNLGGGKGSPDSVGLRPVRRDSSCRNVLMYFPPAAPFQPAGVERLPPRWPPRLPFPRPRRRPFARAGRPTSRLPQPVHVPKNRRKNPGGARAGLASGATRRTERAAARRAQALPRPSHRTRCELVHVCDFLEQPMAGRRIHRSQRTGGAS